MLRLLRHMCPRIECREAGQAVICQDDVERPGVGEALEFRESVYLVQLALEP